MVLKISNRDARRLWITAQGLAETPTGLLNLPAIIANLGFVQLDTIQIVARAHHHILWSRNQHYREPMLNDLLANDRAVFEHFTHDASIIPIDTYPNWERQFKRKKKQIRAMKWYESMLDSRGRSKMKTRIRNEGPLSTHAFDSTQRKREVFSRPPHKLALDYMWFTGELSTSHRENFTKFYDLTERVIPKQVREKQRTDEEQIDWLCRAALERLAFATEGEIMRFWEATDLREVKQWVAQNRDELQSVEVTTADGGTTSGVALANIEERLDNAPTLTSRLRILNPFDPVVRDRTRLLRLFGFDYRIEIFVPAAKRKWGYYVFPVLEGDRFVGRVETRADRKDGVLNVLKFWPEADVEWSARRYEKLNAELKRLGRLAGTTTVLWK